MLFYKKNLVLSKKQIVLIIIVSKLLATAFSLFVFNQFTPLVDAKLYQDEMYANSEHFRVYFIQSITQITNFITSPIISHFIFSFFSILGILWLVVSRSTKWPILLILFLPSSMIWTSVIGKESIFYLCFSLLLIIWSDYIKNKFTFNHLFILILSTLICLILRPHYALCLPWLFWVAIILKKTSNYKLIFLASYLSLLVIIIFIIFFGEHIDNFFKVNLFDLRWRALSGIDIDGRASRHFDLGLDKHITNRGDISNHFVTQWNTTAALKDFNHFFGLGFIFGIIGPFISEVIARPIFTPFFIEGIIILFSPLIILSLIIKNKLYSKNDVNCLNYIYGVLPAIIILMIVHAFFGILNPGSAIRWRVNFELIFYFAPLLLYFNILELNNKKK